jgi:cytochrome c
MTLGAWLRSSYHLASIRKRARERSEMKVTMLRVGAAALVAVFSSVGAMAADAAHGKELFIACAACHTEKPDAIGPNLKGVFGRKSAALDDFRYSNPMKRANLVWDATNLRAYLLDPQAKVKGNRMPFGGVANPSEADDLVAYLQAYK